ncbi:MAG: twin transmembrane helix small protein [Gammaproteobacteria bacterium]|nr:twin transmembrane helix small protein [Gammaproteobacteria bacterium]
MTAQLIFKGIIVLLLIAVFISLTSGLAFLVRDQGKTERTVKSLTVRVVLSLALIILLVVGFALGLIQPHGLPRAP